MDFKAVIELVKFTLTLSAACFVYTLEKLTPAPTEYARWYALILLLLFTLSSLGGLLIFSSATAALNSSGTRVDRQRKLIRRMAYVHIGFLALGVMLLGGRLVEKVLTEVPAAPALARELR